MSMNSLLSFSLILQNISMTVFVDLYCQCMKMGGSLEILFYLFHGTGGVGYDRPPALHFFDHQHEDATGISHGTFQMVFPHYRIGVPADFGDVPDLELKLAKMLPDRKSVV